MAMPQPRGPISTSETLMGKLLLLSPEFKLFAKENLPAQPANNRIHYGIIDRPDKELDYFTAEDLNAVRPFVCIYPEGISSARIASQAVQFNGSVRCLFESSWDDAKADDPSLETEADVLRWWKNRVGVILSQAICAGHDTVFSFRRMTQMAWWTRSPVEPTDQTLGFACLIDWGPDEP